MEFFQLFVNLFIAKERRERWFYLSDHPEKLYGKLRQLERHLNTNCRFVEKQMDDEIEQFIKKHWLSDGYYFSFSPYKDSGYLSAKELENVVAKDYGDFIVIYPKKKVAIYYHHEGWVWLCEQRS